MFPIMNMKKKWYIYFFFFFFYMSLGLVTILFQPINFHVGQAIFVNHLK